MRNTEHGTRNTEHGMRNTEYGVNGSEGDSHFAIMIDLSATVAFYANG
jgi:hypothetical protein